jgi:hypothetical protein
VPPALAAALGDDPKRYDGIWVLPAQAPNDTSVEGTSKQEATPSVHALAIVLLGQSIVTLELAHACGRCAGCTHTRAHT